MLLNFASAAMHLSASLKLLLTQMLTRLPTGILLGSTSSGQDFAGFVEEVQVLLIAIDGPIAIVLVIILVRLLF